jgi:hypothetical protein
MAVRWRRRAVLGVVGLWGIVAVARATRLVEPPEARPGPEVEPMLQFLRVTIPPDAGYLYVLPGAFAAGDDTGAAPRLRYELFPRTYDDVRLDVPETTVRDTMRARGLRYIVVPDAQQYPPDAWLRQPRDWLKRTQLSDDQYVLTSTDEA